MKYWQEHGGGEPARLSPLGLAFIGDAVYETMVRERILLAGNRPVSALHRDAVHYVCAHSQSAAYTALEPVLTERETQVLHRGRNCSSARTPKSSSVIDYRRATAVEALFGYLHLCGEYERLGELMELAYAAIDSGEEARAVEGVGAAE